MAEVIIAPTRGPREPPSQHRSRTRSAPATGVAELSAMVGAVLNRHAAVGLALGVVRDGRLESFHGHGIANLGSRAPIVEDTVFRIGSITKTFTAVAVMQLWEQGLIDLDAPASEYLRGYQLVRADPGFREPTLRHLLTHTAGIPDVRRVGDLLDVAAGPWDARPPARSVPPGQALPSLAEEYAHGLEVVAQPGSCFAYSGHGFATLGQIVEDVSGMPLGRSLRERLFQPLGMTATGLARTDLSTDRYATGYVFGGAGPEAVQDRDWSGAGAGGAYSTTRDLGRYASALLNGGANGHGRMLRSPTLATMFERHYEVDPALPAMGLGFFVTDVAGHRVLTHDGILPGFNSHLAVVPDARLGLIALTNGSVGAMRWIPEEMAGLLRWLLDGAEEVRPAVPHHPETWSEIVGRYAMPPRVSDLRGRLAMGGGLDVFVRGGRPMVRLRLPVPSVWRGLPLEPDDDRDPLAFRVDLARFGMGPVRLRFRRDRHTGRRVIHSDLGGQPISFESVERGRSRRRRLVLAGAGAAAAAILAVRRHRCSDA
jgi:CubicO group peptidase (beta-lactamase class C family)